MLSFIPHILGTAQCNINFYALKESSNYLFWFQFTYPGKFPVYHIIVSFCYLTHEA